MDELYFKLGSELRSLFKDLFTPNKATLIRKKMDQILATAHQIGGTVSKEAKRLSQDIDQFLEDPKNPELVRLMKEHALRLEQETREL